MLGRISLERATNIAILALVPICAASWIYHFVAMPTARARTTPAPRYAQGDRLADVAELAALPATPAVLIFVNSNCRFCAENMPFYGRLLEQVRARRSGLRVVIAAREPMTSLEAYVKGHALQPDDVVALTETTSFKESTTPALMMLDSERRITHIWFGVVAAVDEPRILAEIARVPGFASGAVTSGSR
jgi:hypothetical protein